MIAVITGDIIQSRKAGDPNRWLQPLKDLLHTFGETPETWEIFRGDSFQLELLPEDSLEVAFKIKAVIKSIQGLDVRIAIGIGEKSYTGQGISESTGSAFVYSGDTLESLKRSKETLRIRSPWEKFDRDINLVLKLLLIVADEWSVISAETAQVVLGDSNLSQQSLAERFGISQSSVSARYHRAHLDAVLEVLTYFRDRIREQL